MSFDSAAMVRVMHRGNPYWRTTLVQIDQANDSLPQYIPKYCATLRLNLPPRRVSLDRQAHSITCLQ